VVIDATCPFGYGYQLPRGLLRESMDGLNRADAVLITRCHAVDPKNITSIRQTVTAFNAETPILASDHTPIGLLEYPDSQLPLADIKQQKVGVLSAIGNPDAFEMTVRQCGAIVQSSRHLPDHDPYSPETVTALREWAENLDSEIKCIVCTHKDLVKLQTDRLGGKRLVALQIELTLHGNEQALDELLEPVAKRASVTPSMHEPDVRQTDANKPQFE
jgi:tetraacyldisaccharide 4'-kinase